MPRRTYLTNKIAILLTVALISFILAVLCTDNYINNNGSSLKNIIIFWCVFVISFIGGSLGYFKYVGAFGSTILVIYSIINSSSFLAAVTLALGISWLTMFLNRRYK